MKLSDLHIGPTPDKITEVSANGIDPLSIWTENAILSAYDEKITSLASFLYYKRGGKYRKYFGVEDAIQNGRLGAINFIRRRQIGPNYSHMIMMYAKNEIQRGGREEGAKRTGKGSRSHYGTPKDYLGLLPYGEGEWAGQGRRPSSAPTLVPRTANIDVEDPDETQYFLEQLPLDDREKLDEIIAAARLTYREDKILSMILAGQTRSDMTAELGVSEVRISQIIKKLFSKLGLGGKQKSILKPRRKI